MYFLLSDINRRGDYIIHSAEVLENDRDHWKARAEALERAALRNVKQLPCITCQHDKDGRCPQWLCTDSNYEYWQFDQARFAGGDS